MKTGQSAYVFFVFLFFISLLNHSAVHSQEFQVSPLITIPGNNFDFDVLSDNSNLWGSDSTYLCWVNQLDSIYTIYAQEIGPGRSAPVPVYSAASPNRHPQIAFLNGIGVVWQSFNHGHWQLKFRNVWGDSLGDVINLTDSLTDNVSPSLSNYRVVWIRDGGLFTRVYRSDWESAVKIDSNGCSNPDISKWEYGPKDPIVYEKGEAGRKKIYKAGYFYDKETHQYYWGMQLISSTEKNKNPRVICRLFIFFQSFIDGVWKITAAGPDFYLFSVTKNRNCNYEHPDYFRYSIPTSSFRKGFTPFFLTFDSDSLPNNREIFIRTFTFDGDDTTMAISNAGGEDSKPRTALVHRGSDSAFVAIIWEHSENNRKSIWWAKAPYTPLPGAVREETTSLSDFKLFQNYPNPFNGRTTISYQLPENSFVKIQIFNVEGQLVENAVNAFQKAGRHYFTWSVKNKPSGVYFYEIGSRRFHAVKRCLYLK